MVPKLTGHWLFWLRQPPLLIPVVPHGEQEIRQGGQKFCPQLPGSAPAQEIERWTPSTPPHHCSRPVHVPQDFPPSPLLPTGEAAQTSPKLSSSWVLGRRPLHSWVAGRVGSGLSFCSAHGNSPLPGSQVCLPAKGKHFLNEQTALLERLLL